MCLEQAQLIQLVSGELPVTQRAQALAHLEDCEKCREQLAAMRQTWEMLGQWTIAAPQTDAFVQRVLSSARVATAVVSKRAQTRRYVMRLAAAVAIASGVGIAAARIMPLPSKQIQSRSDVSDEQVIQAMGLDALSGDSASTFGDLYDTDDTAGVEEEPS